MKNQPVIAVFDIGKTNKKLVLLNQAYEVVYEKSAVFTETAGEDGFPCEDLATLRPWVLGSLRDALRIHDVKAVNFSAYGSALVLLGKSGRVLTPLYNYLKPFPSELLSDLKNKPLPSEIASPIFGSLNSGLQLYRLKAEKPAVFKQLKYALHLPQYLSFLLTGKFYSDITSIGCHTALWDFTKNKYHQWVEDEKLMPKLAPLTPGDTVFETRFEGHRFSVGVGIHDSSAALIPYFQTSSEPFVLISTGTWCVTMNAFDATPLSSVELEEGCVCYLRKAGMPVKASRLFLGNAYQQEVSKIAERFGLDVDCVLGTGVNSELFPEAAVAYHQLMADLVRQQADATRLVMKGTAVKRIFVDGGFSLNLVFMNLLSAAFSGIPVFAAIVPQASAIGAALAIHQSWNGHSLPGQVIKLQHFADTINQEQLKCN